MRWHLDHVEWGEYAGGYQFYVYWWPNWLTPDVRHLGVQRYWLDGPHVSLGLWWFNFTWSTWRCLPPFEFCNDALQTKWSRRPIWIKRLFGMEAA